MQIMTNATSIFAERCIIGVAANEERCRELLERNPAVATALAPRLGYAEAAKLAKEAVERNMTVRELVAEKGILSAEELDRILDLRAMTEPGVPGRSSPSGC